MSKPKPRAKKGEQLPKRRAKKNKQRQPADPAATAAASFVARQASDFLAAQTAANKVKFIEAFADTGNVSAAAQLAGGGRRTHYDWLPEDPAESAAYAEAGEDAAAGLEIHPRRPAVDGVTQPVFHQGIEIATLQKYSDTLLIFLLKGARPEKYAEHHVHGGKGKGGAIKVTLEDIVAGSAEDKAAA
jgi:hypothetical protein